MKLSNAFAAALTSSVLAEGVQVRVHGNYQYLSQPPIQDSTALRMRCRSIARDTEWGFAWVGISKDNLESRLQSGVDSVIGRCGKVSYAAWHEWLPNETCYLDNFNVTGGDVIRVDAATTSTTMGNVGLINVSTGSNVSMDVTARPGTFLTGDHAEWIMEDVWGWQTLRVWCSQMLVPR